MFARVYTLFTLFAFLGMILSVSASPVLFPSYATGPLRNNKLDLRSCLRVGACKLGDADPSDAASSSAVVSSSATTTLATEYIPESSSSALVPEATPAADAGTDTHAGKDAGPVLAAQSSGAREVVARLPVGPLAALSAVASVALFVL